MASSSSSLVNEIFKDFTGRRTAVIRALTKDADKFHELCDPDKDTLCLYGHPNETWEVRMPLEDVPPAIPDPVLGINFARDYMSRKHWLAKVALHSDSWLLSVAFYNGACLNRTGRERLFSWINDLPTVFEVVTGMKHIKDSPIADAGSASKPRTKTKRFDVPDKRFLDFSDEGNKEHEDQILCESCCGNDNGSEFWIGCDICEKWFHGRCVEITSAMAKSIKKYKCSSCSLRQG